jgi:multicomponent Na+:H+ antiporter subunit B
MRLPKLMSRRNNMAHFFSILFMTGLLFLLSILSGLLPFAEAPMLIGQVIQQDALPATGTANLVTSVVLGYRGIDTLGELSILFAAAAGGGLVLGRRRAGISSVTENTGDILKSGVDLLFPLLLVTGLYIVLHGHLTPGGGFQGGVLLATAFFLPVLARPAQKTSHSMLSLVEGLAGASFIAIGLLALYNGGEFLQPLLGKGTAGQLMSGGTLPLLYIAVGLKVGAELAGLLATLADDNGGNTDAA